MSASGGQVLSVLLTGTTWRAAGVDGIDDLGAVDAVEVDRSDAEVGVAELAARRTTATISSIVGGSAG